MRQETARLIVREYTIQDLHEVHAYGSDPVVVKYMLWGPNSIKETQDFIALAISEDAETPRSVYNLAIEHQQTHSLIGGISLHIKNHEAEIGWILNQKAWGQGYATEAAQAMIDFGFEHLSLKRITATCDAENRSSYRVMIKCGMTQFSYQNEVRASSHFSTQKRDQRRFEIARESYLKTKIGDK